MLGRKSEPCSSVLQRWKVAAFGGCGVRWTIAKFVGVHLWFTGESSEVPCVVVVAYVVDRSDGGCGRRGTCPCHSSSGCGGVERRRRRTRPVRGAVPDTDPPGVR